MKVILEEALKRLPIKGRCGVAVSGGGDSMALALLLQELLGEVVALHFDHGLRLNSAEEALWVAQQLQPYHIPTITDRWASPDGESNLQQKARQARYRFFKQACDDTGLQAVFVAHSADDMAETLLMRLGRGSGLHGLAVLPEVAQVQGVQVFRPLLKIRRADLRNYLQSRGQTWLEDPSNVNLKFWRPRVRNLLPILAESGVGVESLNASVQALHDANDALASATEILWATLATQASGEVVLNWSGVMAQPREIQLRLVQKALRHFTPPDEQLPRRRQILDALQALSLDPRQRSLGKTLCRREEGALCLISTPMPLQR